MPRKTIAGLEAIIAEKDNRIAELSAKLAGYDDGKAPDLSIWSTLRPATESEQSVSRRTRPRRFAWTWPTRFQFR